MPSFAAPADTSPLAALRTALGKLDQGLSVLDHDLCLVAWNQAFLQLLDLPHDLLHVGMPFQQLLSLREGQNEASSQDVHAELAQRVAERTRELQTINAQLRAANARNEAIAQSLQRSEAQMRLITDSIPALIAYFDKHRNYRYINRGYQEWFGLNPREPERISAREYLGSATYERIRPNVAQALAGRPVTFEYELQQISGRKLLVRTSLIPERSSDGTVVGCFELTFDITEQKRSHDMLVQAQKMEALGHLTGGLAHDFNNILTVIIGNLSALADARPGDALVGEFVEPAVQAARRGAELIKGLLSFSRQQPLEPQAVDVAAQIESVRRLVRRSLPEDLALRVETCAGTLWAWADPNLLQNALLNLLLNARDATTGPGARICMRASRCTSAQGCHGPLGLPPGRYVRLDVGDNGVGMDEATRQRVFEPFFTTKRPGLGTGLGLAMVHDFVRQSGGAIDIASAPGAGTTVSIWLPMAEEDTDIDPPTDAEIHPAAPHPSAPDNPTAQRGLALLVEDEAQVRRVVRAQLLQLGYAVIEAENGAEAQALLAQMPGIQLLLSDVVMPGSVDGRSLARLARDECQVPVVALMSGYAPTADKPQPEADIPMLAKPFTKTELASFLKQHQP